MVYFLLIYVIILHIIISKLDTKLDKTTKIIEEIFDEKQEMINDLYSKLKKDEYED